MLGVTDAVGEEERESCGEVVPIAMREAGDAPSDAEMSRFISSLLRRDTEKVIMRISSAATVELTEASRQTTARTAGCSEQHSTELLVCHCGRQRYSHQLSYGTHPGVKQQRKRQSNRGVYTQPISFPSQKNKISSLAGKGMQLDSR